MDDDWADLYRWFGYTGVICPGDIRKAIKENPEGEDLVFEVNSGGGSVFAGFEMYSVLRGAACRTVAEVQSLAASAASTVISGCAVVMLSPVAQIMIHLPTTWTEGDEYEHRSSAAMLRSFKESILNGYVARAAGKSTRAQLSGMMDRTTFFEAHEAVDAGLADGVLDEGGGEPVDPVGVINAMTWGGLPPIGELRARYEAAVGQGTPSGAVRQLPEREPSDTAGDIRLARARMEIERLRY